ncbi:MAG: class I SAM-dependent methyltransferase [Ornithinimicrobium sp.]
MSPPRTSGRSKKPAPSWASYRKSIGDRSGMFEAVADTWRVSRALYLGSYLDLSPSTAIPSVTYVDTDRRAAAYFADNERIAADLEGRTRVGAGVDVDFIAADFTGQLPLPDASIDLVISLYTVPAWDHCRRYMRPGGFFLANSSHGDASLAALDPSLELVAAIKNRGDRYRLDTDDLGRYLVPKKPENADADAIRTSGRGVAYTRSAFAYLFRLV